MAAQLVNDLSWIKHCSGVNGQNSIVSWYPRNDWTAEKAIIASDEY